MAETEAAAGKSNRNPARERSFEKVSVDDYKIGGISKMKQDLMKGVIDMHVHTNPDLRLRAYDDFELMEAAIRVGARAIVIKTHQGTTMDRAYLCNRHNEIVHGKTNNFTMFGSITLNKVVGGINPKAERWNGCLKKYS